MTATKKMSTRSLTTESDDDLLRRGAENPESRVARDAICELFRRYQGRVYQWCFRYTKNHDRAMDMSQEVFLGAYQSLNLKMFGGRASFSSWLFAIARNRCVSAMRRNSPLENAAGDPDLVADHEYGPDRDVEDEQERQALLDLMRATLEPMEQDVMCLQVFDRMPVDSITEVLNMPGSTGARGVLQNARRKLRAALIKRSESQGDPKHD
jgi:RNA polymerase sigma-70 factor (ECF subfamily)